MTRKSLETRLFILNMLPYVPYPLHKTAPKIGRIRDMTTLVSGAQVERAKPFVRFLYFSDFSSLTFLGDMIIAINRKVRISTDELTEAERWCDEHGEFKLFSGETSKMESLLKRLESGKWKEPPEAVADPDVVALPACRIEEGELEPSDFYLFSSPRQNL